MKYKIINYYLIKFIILNNKIWKNMVGPDRPQVTVKCDAQKM